jgi:hypothetical protein
MSTSHCKWVGQQVLMPFPVKPFPVVLNNTHQGLETLRASDLNYRKDENNNNNKKM